MRRDKFVVLTAVRADGDNLKYAAWSLRNDYDVVLAAVQQDADALGYAMSELQKNKYLVKVVALKRAWRKWRWQRLVRQAVRFNKEDKEYHASLDPMNIMRDVEELGGVDDYEGPAPPRFWNMIMNKRQKLL